MNLWTGSEEMKELVFDQRDAVASPLNPIVYSAKLRAAILPGTGVNEA